MTGIRAAFRPPDHANDHASSSEVRQCLHDAVNSGRLTSFAVAWKASGEIEDYIPVLLGPHGGELDGFTLIIGDEAKLLQLTLREDLHRLQLRAEREHAKFSVIPAIIGGRVEREYKIVEEEILPIFERTPIAV